MATAFTLPRPRRLDVQQVPREDADRVRVLTENGYVNRGTSRGLVRLVKRRTDWDLFEHEVLIFLMDGLKLEHVDGGTCCRFGGHQVDACGGLDGLFLVVDAKQSGDPGAANSRAMVDDLARKMVAIRRDVLTKHAGIYETVCFVIFTNAEATPADIEYALNHGVFLVDGRYYKEICKGLHSAIGPFARYQLFRDFLRSLQENELPVGWRSGGRNRVKFPALRITSPRNVSLYSCFIPASDLLRLGYVARLESRTPGAYQRLLKKEKLAGVAEFVHAKNVFKNNIVVGLHEKPKFVRLRGSGDGVPAIGHLSLEDVPASVWVIDGQHRLYGFASLEAAERNQLLPVMVMYDAKPNQGDQALTFVEINKYQTPITPDVLWALYSEVQPRSADGVVSAAVKVLATKGFFKDKIYVPDLSRRSREGYRLFMNNVCAGMVARRLLDPNNPGALSAVKGGGGADWDAVREALVSTIDAYFVLVAKAAESHPAWIRDFALTNNGFNILLRLLPELLVMTNGKWAKAKASRVLAEPLSAFFADNVGMIATLRSASSEASRAEAAARMMARVHDHDQVFAHAYLHSRHRQMLRSPESELLRDFEQLLREFIAQVLSERLGKDWENALPPEVAGLARGRKDSNEKLWPWARNPGAALSDFLDFNDYAKIFKYKWVFFEPVLREQDIVMGKLRELDPMRKDVMHARNLEPREYQRLAMYFEDFKKLVADAAPTAASTSQP